MFGDFLFWFYWRFPNGFSVFFHGDGSGWSYLSLYFMFILDVQQFPKPPVSCSESSPEHNKSVNAFTHGSRLCNERDLKVCPSVRPVLLLLRYHDLLGCWIHQCLTCVSLSKLKVSFPIGKSTSLNVWTTLELVFLINWTPPRLVAWAREAVFISSEIVLTVVIWC